MADFMSNLWESVFTPGTTPTLLLATNATFAFLQMTLLALLVATYSIHFVILSVLCGGLWWAINWFAYELHQAQAQEAQAEQAKKGADSGTGTDTEPDASSTVEVGTGKTSEIIVEYKPSAEDELIRKRVLEDVMKSGEATAHGTGSKLEASSARQRRQPMDASGELSTDSEWEKVEQEER